MADEGSRKDIVLQWAPIVISLGVIFWNTAYVSKQVEQNRIDIEKLERRLDNSATTATSIDSRLARIEATLDIITGASDLKRSRINADHN